MFLCIAIVCAVKLNLNLKLLAKYPISINAIARSAVSKVGPHHAEGYRRRFLSYHLSGSQNISTPVPLAPQSVDAQFCQGQGRAGEEVTATARPAAYGAHVPWLIRLALSARV